MQQRSAGDIEEGLARAADGQHHQRERRCLRQRHDRERQSGHHDADGQRRAQAPPAHEHRGGAGSDDPADTDRAGHDPGARFTHRQHVDRHDRIEHVEQPDHHELCTDQQGQDQCSGFFPKLPEAVGGLGDDLAGRLLQGSSLH